MTDLGPWGRTLLHQAARAEGGTVVVGRGRQDVAASLERHGLVKRTAAWQCHVTADGWAEAHRRWPQDIAPPPTDPPTTRSPRA